MKYSLNPSIAVPLVLCDSRALYRSDINSTSSRTGGFIGNGCFPMRYGGVALGNMGDGLVASFRLKDMRSGVDEEG